MIHFFLVGCDIFFLAFNKLVVDAPKSLIDPPPPPLEASDAFDVALATPALDDLLEGDSELPLSLPPFLLLEVMLRPLGVVDEPFEGLFSGELA